MRYKLLCSLALTLILVGVGAVWAYNRSSTANLAAPAESVSCPDGCCPFCPGDPSECPPCCQSEGDCPQAAGCARGATAAPAAAAQPSDCPDCPFCPGW